ncbi:MAG: hypothetical protein SV422_03530 [Pseudomonadota bacterium]|nr:hypothetical protein [Pseudomonadota bacterium]
MLHADSVFKKDSIAKALLLAAAAVLSSCAPSDPLQQQAEEFVELALSVGIGNPDEIDAWFGPAALDPRGANSTAVPPEELLADAKALLADIETLAPALTSAAESQRSAKLERRVEKFIVLLETLAMPKALSFADEALQLYDITLPAMPLSVEEQQALMDAIEALLPGQGTLAFRVAALQNRLVVPPDKRVAVFERALAECRARTLAHWDLPADEQITLEWTRDVASAWHRYEGDNRSTLQINSLALPFVGSALDVACHEGYPGHHAQFVLMENATAPEPLNVEDQLALLRSPESVLREGAANYGVEMAFTAEERLAFERDVLFPLAGLSPELAGQHADVQKLVGRLSAGVIPLLQQYRDGTLSFNSATFDLEREALVSSPSALLQYVDKFGAYSVGYTVAKTRLQDHIDHSGKDPWTELRRILVESDVTVLQTPDANGASAVPTSAAVAP